jgi:hypothetical protein
MCSGWEDAQLVTALTQSRNYCSQAEWILDFGATSESGLEFGPVLVTSLFLRELMIPGKDPKRVLKYVETFEEGSG